MTVVHDIGALVFFLFGVIYIILQTVISYQAYPYGSSVSVCRARLVIAIIAFLAFFPSILSQTSNMLKYQKSSYWFPDILSIVSIQNMYLTNNLD